MLLHSSPLARLMVQAKENFKVKEAFEMLIKKIISDNPKSTKGADKSAPSGVFGDGKGDDT